ncbi:MAG TPA: DUF3300 domain-containing protein [Geobacteraceae bacterium]
MKKVLLMHLAALLALGLVAGHGAWADDYQPAPAETMAQSGDLFTAEELDELLAPIALYPDPLLAQILPAATFIDQIDAAARYVRLYGVSARIDDQPWDVSVRALAHYPDVLFMLDQKYDWTVSLGQAYVNQPQEVMDAIQRLRAEARAEGNLVSTSQQQVLIEDDYIRIVPAEPEVIYVPQYDPLVVYAEPPPPYGFITFGIGFTIGAWLNRDCDWHGHRVYYHGWRGGGWVNRARPYVNPRRSVYINNRYSAINVNRRVVQHDTARYREDIRRNMEYRREHRPPPVAPGREVRPRGGGEIRATTPPAAPRPPAPQPSATPRTPPAPRPATTDVYRGRETRGAQPAANTGYGGYGSGGDAKTYRERGQSSRENMRQFNRPQSAPGNVTRPAPAQAPRPGASGGRQSAPAAATPRPASPAPASRGGGVQRQR